MQAVVNYYGISSIYLCCFYQSSENEEDHEKASEGCFSTHISITHCGHGYHEQVHTLPVGKRLGILETFPRIS